MKVEWPMCLSLKFDETEKNEKIIRETWEIFRNQLANRSFTYDDINTALEDTVFLRVFDEFFSHGHKWLEKELSNVFTSNTDIVRAAHIKDDSPPPTYDRFIPNAKFSKSHNRFSPPGFEWLYLAIGPKSNSEAGFSLAEKCALKECRASSGDHYALCSFQLKEGYNKKKIIDLTIAKDMNYEDINSVLKQHGDKIYKREKERMAKTILVTGKSPAPNTKDYEHRFFEWAIYTYARLLAEQIFLPLKTENRELMYSPFQCIAKYFLLKGYAGIVYSSTVFPDGRNLVLFDKKTAEPFNPIKEFIVTDEL